MSIEEAQQLGLRAIRHATYRDPYSGGIINIYLCDENGWRQLCRIDANQV